MIILIPCIQKGRGRSSWLGSPDLLQRYPFDSAARSWGSNVVPLLPEGVPHSGPRWWVQVVVRSVGKRKVLAAGSNCRCLRSMDRGTSGNPAASCHGAAASAEGRTGRHRTGRGARGRGWRALLTALACVSGPLGVSLAAEHPAWIAAEPILTAHCVSCHGEEKPKGGLVLTSAAGARMGGEIGRAHV